MKVIISGAGQVGSNIAAYLASENNDVTVIDPSASRIKSITDHMDVKAMIGKGSHPDTLEAAGAADSDLLIAVSPVDEINMVTCQIAHSLFNMPTKIARIREQSYLRPIWRNLFQSNQMPIDVIISPEREVAKSIVRRLQLPGAFDMVPLMNERIKIVGVQCGPTCPILNTPLRQLTTLFPDLHINVIAIIRNNRPMIPTGDEQMFVGDEVYFACDSDHLKRSMVAFGHEEQRAHRLIILGGGNIGLFLAEDIEKGNHPVQARLIEHNRERAQFIARHLSKTTVIHGDALDPDILEEAHVSDTETVVAVTNDDETNILGSLLAKRYGCQRAITLINRLVYSSLMTPIGIDTLVSPRDTTVSTILQHVRRGRILSVHALREGFAEVIEAEALENSPLVNIPLGDIHLPTGIIIGAIVRGDQVIIPRPQTIVRPHDLVIILAEAGQIRRVEQMFSVSLEFF